MKQKRGQNWSIDIMIAVALFAFILSLFFLKLSSMQRGELRLLVDTAEVINAKMETSEDGGGWELIQGGEIDWEDFRGLSGWDYEYLKNELGIEGEFCIYIEDEEGNIITINGTTLGVGSDNLTVGNFSC